MILDIDILQRNVSHATGEAIPDRLSPAADHIASSSTPGLWLHGSSASASLECAKLAQLYSQLYHYCSSPILHAQKSLDIFSQGVAGLLGGLRPRQGRLFHIIATASVAMVKNPVITRKERSCRPGIKPYVLSSD